MKKLLVLEVETGGHDPTEFTDLLREGLLELPIGDKSAKKPVQLALLDCLRERRGVRFLSRYLVSHSADPNVGEEEVEAQSPAEAIDIVARRIADAGYLLPPREGFSTREVAS